MFKRVITAIRLFFDYKRKARMVVETFAHTNRNYLVIVADPKDDTLFMGYKDIMVRSQIKSADGKNQKVVKYMLKHSRFNSKIDQFIVSLMENMKTTIQDGNNFFQWVDGATFNISKALKKEKQDVSQKQIVGKILENVREEGKV